MHELRGSVGAPLQEAGKISHRGFEAGLSQYERLNGAPLALIKRLDTSRDSRIVPSQLTMAPGAGASAVDLVFSLPDGRKINLFPPRSLSALDGSLQDSKDPFPANALYKSIDTPLFPLGNRIAPETPVPGRPILTDAFLGDGVTVRVPLNNRADKENAIPHHLHGFMHPAKPVSEPQFASIAGGLAMVTSYAGFLNGFWSPGSDFDVKVMQGIGSEGYVYSLRAKNIGTKRTKVGAYTHPYFKIPSGKPAQALLRLGGRTLEIDNYANVLPTGRILSATGKLGFSGAGEESRLGRKFLDNCWIDLPRDAQGRPFIELIDPAANLVIRMTGLTPNIRTAQVFYPGKGDVIAMELGTHLPDPRPALWRGQPTGLEILEPGEDFQYSFLIQLLPL